MLKTFRQQIAMAALFFTLPIVSILISADVKPAFAGCNIFGCSQSSEAECNPFGCPNAPLGKVCTPFGCPESPQEAEQNDRPRRRHRDQDDDQRDSTDSGRVIKSIASAGSYWVYQKPSDISDSQMQSAGAAFYSSPQACSMHYSLCTTLGGVWLSQQQSLVIQNP